MTLTPAERERVQDLLAKRYLQLRLPKVGERKGDQP